MKQRDSGRLAPDFRRRQSELAVSRGENSGRTLRNTNVVRDLQKIGTWTGEPLEIRLPASALTAGEGGRDGCVIIVQAEDFGLVLGVRKLALSDNPS